MAEAAAIYILIGMAWLAFMLWRAPHKIPTYRGDPQWMRVTIFTLGPIVWVVFWLPLLLTNFSSKMTKPNDR